VRYMSQNEAFTKGFRSLYKLLKTVALFPKKFLDTPVFDS